jgi:hypothetical protein
VACGLHSIQAGTEKTWWHEADNTTGVTLPVDASNGIK